ncbi:MAG: hypothetical protein J1E85_06695 [Ruminococcus sp.]|nr:hypothetical protein [Ruminococcus sp.]
MQLYDMHSHILPEFDDGAKSVEEALSLISVLKKQGVKNICLTPHFYTHEMSVEDFVKIRREAFEKFKPYIPKDVNIVLGTEVYVTRYLFGNNDLSELSYGNSRYILTEFGYNSRFSENTMNKFYSFINEHNLIPVIPHVERYQTLIDNPSIISELKDMGVVIQTNISNYAKKAPMFKRRKMLKLISKGLIDIIGSDAHSLRHNTPEVYSEAINCISSKCGEQVVEQMMNNAKEIFENAL